MEHHVYTVELRFHGDSLSPDEFTAVLGLSPSTAREAQSADDGRRSRVAVWGYNGWDREGFREEWDSLGDGLDFVLSAVESRRDALSRMAERFGPVWWCGHFQSGFDGGPTLSPGLMKRLGEFGVPLFIDNYQSSIE